MFYIDSTKSTIICKFYTRQVKANTCIHTYILYLLQQQQSYSEQLWQGRMEKKLNECVAVVVVHYFNNAFLYISSLHFVCKCRTLNIHIHRLDSTFYFHFFVFFICIFKRGLRKLSADTWILSTPHTPICTKCIP